MLNDFTQQRRPVPGFLVLVAGLGFLSAGCAPKDPLQASLPDEIDYNWDVRPILSDNCFRCHGHDEKKREAGLRLDERDSAVAELPESPGKHAIVPGDPDGSELIRRITNKDPDEVMPPPETHKVLSERDIAILKAWIDDGAKYKAHWAYVAPEHSKPPRSKFSGQAANDIDRFVFAKLEKEGLNPSAPADPETLINRVTLTLTGLPPSLEEVDAFVADKSPGAYEKLVDRLLASPAYAEHMATQWLDIARYSESDGFLDDAHNRLFWPYRDWVINSLAKNMPFNEFGTWQLAGDILAKTAKDPKQAREETLATAFLRVGRRTTENGAIDEEYRVENVIDRTNTVGTGFLGLTTGCAQCHDHKYDPISHSDFYALTGFFNSNDEPGYYSFGVSGIQQGPTLPWTDAATEARIAAAASEVLVRETDYREARTAAAAKASPNGITADRLEATMAAATIGYFPFDTARTMSDAEVPRLQFAVPRPPLAPPMRPPVKVEPPSGQGPSAAPPANARRGGDRPPARFLGAAPPSSDPNQVVLAAMIRGNLRASPNLVPGGKPAIIESPLLRPGIKGNALYFDDTNKGFLDGHFARFERTQPFSIDIWVKPGQEYPEATVYSNRDIDSSGGQGYALLLVENHLRFSMMHSRAGNMIRIHTRQSIPVNEWSHVTVTYDGSSRAAGVGFYVNGVSAEVDVDRDNLTQTILPGGAPFGAFDAYVGFAFGKRFRDFTLKDGAIDELRVFNRTLTPLEVSFLHQGAAAFKENPAGLRDELGEYVVSTDETVAQAYNLLMAARQAHNVLVSSQPQIMVMGDTPTPRPTYVLGKGLYSNHEQQVEPQGLNQIFPWDASLPRNRLGLARWLFDLKNPLTARVFVNRLWQMQFGKGLVETAEDFGAQGSIPTNPELLDWLATEFVQSGWDVKHMQKLLVMSATYAQTSDATDELIQRDPQNRLLARGLRIRMPAEMVRDQALAASGLLIRQVGGPSTYPYQPDGIWGRWIDAVYPDANAVPDDQHHRRSLYSTVKRSAPHPAMAVFDMPERNVTSARRRTSNTPLQALVLLNDPQYMEAYRSLAAQALKTEAADLDAQIVRVFRLATRRVPRAEELTLLRSYYEAQRTEFAAEPDKAVQLLSIGVTPVPTDADNISLAALTNVTAAVMNTPDAYSIR
jgi:Protein of unknown function (DUF1553)/Protein of unknown function (DUF1549)/Concanavalin A-like lectin/glucanases superfamily/Planctomycete cytochrome C